MILNLKQRIATLIFSVTVVLFPSVELDYLNSLRTEAGIPAFSEHSTLLTAAQNHSAYLQTNHSSGHSEDSANPGYTGSSASDRAIYVGYVTNNVAENVSSGFSSIEKSVDGLFSAIYHRFGFLSLEYDEIGIGVSSNNLYYTYNMGNSTLRNLCQNSTYTGGSYYRPCTDNTKKVNTSDYNSRTDAIKSNANNLILWPPEDGANIPPSFYEEFPDPLPEHSVTGYPISVQFNTNHFSSPPSVSSFTLEDNTKTQLNSIILMQSNNDPVGKFSPYQFALFPEKKLAWGQKYYVELIYNYNGTSSTKNWCFTTQSLATIAEKFYRIENNSDVSLHIVSGTSYAIYIVPDHTNDTLGSTRYSFTTDTPTFSFIDGGNTISVNATGKIGENISFSFSNGQKIKLTIASTDTATIPTTATCANQPIQDFVSRFYIEILNRYADKSGLNDWSNQLSSGTKTGADIAQGFIHSKEFIERDLTNVAYLTVLYKAFFNREPDTSGFNEWLEQLSNRVNKDTVLNGFLYSQEFKNLADSYGIIAVPKLSPVEQFVTRFYEQCLLRSPDASGLQDWSTQLSNGSRSGADIARGFIFSQEFTDRKLNNSDFLTVLYKAFFNREPDESGFDIWLNKLNSGTDKETILNGFLNALEFTNLTALYGIHAN